MALKFILRFWLIENNAEKLNDFEWMIENNTKSQMNLYEQLEIGFYWKFRFGISYIEA